MLVLDTSVTMGWCFDDETSPYSDAVLERIRATKAVVPSIWPFEVANAMLTGERRGRLSQAAISRFLQLLATLP
jgi:hypothetical protein